jgi:hypothetical protein
MNYKRVCEKVVWCREGGRVLWVEKEKLKLEKWFAEIKKKNKKKRGNHFTWLKGGFLGQPKMFSV